MFHSTTTAVYMKRNGALSMCMKMGYLPEINHRRALRIRCLASTDDDKRSFYDFDEGFLRLDTSSSDHSPEKEACIQEWLYFALINDFCQTLAIHIKHHELIQLDGEGACFLTTRGLHRKILDRVHELRSSKKAQESLRARSSELVRQLINDASDTLFRAFPKVQVPFCNGVSFETVICLSVLLELLNEAFGQLLGVGPIEIRLPDPQEFTKVRMMEAGWCVSTIEDFLPYDPSAAYLATQVESPAFPRIEDHSSCSTFRCLPRNNRSDLHKPVHVATCNEKCGTFEISLDELEAVIESGSIPVLVLERTRLDTSLKLKRKRKAKGGHRYVALSHVWSHGLGNKERNALPRCQVFRIFRSVEQQYPHRGVWIDTLCIPCRRSPPAPNFGISQSTDLKNTRSQTMVKDLRIAAIKDMASIYRLADATIVLDRNLEEVGHSHYQRLLALTASDWMRRLWTYQEMMIGFQDVFVKFHDSLVPIARLLAFEVEGELAEHCIVARRILEDINGSIPFELSAGLFDDGSHKQHALIPIIKNLRRRATTNPSDEFLCLITLLNLDTRLLEEKPTMVTILQALHEVPADLPFCAGDRLDIPGYRWAPSSFLEQPPTSLPIDEAEATPSGVQLLDEEGSAIGFMIIKDSVFLLDEFDIGTSQSSHSEFALIIVDAQNLEPFMVVRPDRHIDRGSAQLRRREIPPPHQCPEGSDWPRKHLIYPAALVLQQSDDDSEKVNGRNVAILLSNITVHRSIEGGEDVYTGEYELCMSCFSPDLVPQETMQSAIRVRGMLSSRTPFVLV